MQRRRTVGFVLAVVAAMSFTGASARSGPDSACKAKPDAMGRVRVGEDVSFVTSSPEHAAAAAVEGPAWREEISYPGASYVAPHFKQLNLPAGASLVVRSPNGERSWTYTGRGKEGPARDGFWGIHIPGSVAVVELFSRVPVAQGAVQIDRFARGFAEAEWPAAEGPEAICGPDDSNWAKCYQTSEPTIYNKGRAIARLLIQGSSGCTGWLVGSAGHLLTNEHCIGSSSDAMNTDYEFMAEGSCTQNCASFGACPGTIVANSATLVKSSAPLDYTLVQLPSNPTGTYGFFQMRTAGASVDERIYIPGHPGAWGKRFAVESSHSSDQSGKCEVFSLNEPPCSGGPGDVGYMCDTQGGSSGSPVVGYGDHAVVSLHHCANCPNRGVPIESVISDLGSSLPPDSTVGGPPPPPPCKPKRAACQVDSECCSLKCKGPAGAKTCK